MEKFPAQDVGVSWRLMVRPGLTSGSHPPQRVAATKLVFVSAPRVQSMVRREGGVLSSGRSLPTSKARAIVAN